VSAHAWVEELHAAGEEARRRRPQPCGRPLVGFGERGKQAGSKK
jgi:hypothetical protein